MAVKKVIIRGREEEVPKGVMDIEAWKNYRRAWIDYKESPSRDYTFSTGVKVKLPYPGLEKFCENEGISSREMKLAQKKAKEFRSLQASITHMKKLAFTAPGQPPITVRSYSFLLKQHETYILELFGKFYNSRQVHKKLLEDKIVVSYEAIHSFFQQNREKIRELRNKAQENIDDLSIGIKRGRLEILDFLLGDLKELYNKQTPSQKISYSKEIRGIVEQARKEVEGDELKLTVNGRIDVTATIETVMRGATLTQDLTIAQMVLSRVAARTGTSYMKLATRLANSFYAKFNGFRKNDNIAEDPIYPSSFNYDIFEMRDRVEELYRVEDASYSIVEEVDREEEDLKVDKEKLLQLLQRDIQGLSEEKKKLL